MKFELSTVGSSYNDKDKERLEGLGFHFKPLPLYSTSWEIAAPYSLMIELETLEDLIELVGSNSIMVEKDNDGQTLTICDDYM